MKRKLTAREIISVASMLFGMFFGAGNLIFPVYMGQMAGRNVWPALIGFLVTGVGLPLLAVAALGVSRSDGLYSLSAKVGRPYGYFFTCLLYLTIGPFFAIPRCASVSYTVGLHPLLGGEAAAARWPLFLFSLVFFVAVLLFSLYPGKILTWIGKILNPFFLLFLGILIVVALTHSTAAISDAAAVGEYGTQPLARGFLDGYNTMDTLAGLAFGIVVVQVIRGLGIQEAGAVAGATVRSGAISCAAMAVIYAAVTLAGAQSQALFADSGNGGILLAQMADRYLGKAGLVILAITVTLACLKTAVGLVTSCGETFVAMFQKGPGYRAWAVIFSAVSLLFANLGLDAIIGYSVPVLMFLYPLAITLIALALGGRLFGHDRAVYVSVTAFTLIGAVYDLLRTLPDGLRALLRLDGALGAVGGVLPLSGYGLGWVCPAAAGLAVGLIVHFARKKAA